MFRAVCRATGMILSVAVHDSSQYVLLAEMTVRTRVGRPGGGMSCLVLPGPGIVMVYKEDAAADMMTGGCALYPMTLARYQLTPPHLQNAGGRRTQSVVAISISISPSPSPYSVPTGAMILRANSNGYPTVTFPATIRQLGSAKHDPILADAGNNAIPRSLHMTASTPYPL